MGLANHHYHGYLPLCPRVPCHRFPFFYLCTLHVKNIAQSLLRRAVTCHSLFFLSILLLLRKQRRTRHLLLTCPKPPLWGGGFLRLPHSLRPPPGLPFVRGTDPPPTAVASATRTWTALPNMRSPRIGCRAVVLEGHLVVLGPTAPPAALTSQRSTDTVRPS